MALFGAPRAREDHAVRACYAALRMQEAVKRYSEEIRHSHGIEAQICMEQLTAPGRGRDALVERSADRA